MTQTDRHTNYSPENNFELALKSAVEIGVWPDPRLRLNADVFDAVGAVADSYPNIDQELVKKARNVFATFASRRAARLASR